MKAMAKLTDWIRRNDPMGGTVKGLIVAVFGLIFITAGGLWLGVTFLVAGLLLFALPLWVARRERHRLGHERSRVGRS